MLHVPMECHVVSTCHCTHFSICDTAYSLRAFNSGWKSLSVLELRWPSCSMRLGLELELVNSAGIVYEPYWMFDLMWSGPLYVLRVAKAHICLSGGRVEGKVWAWPYPSRLGMNAVCCLTRLDIGPDRECHVVPYHS